MLLSPVSQEFMVPKLLTLDFDDTIALTSESAPGIKSVNDAYAEAIDACIGLESAEQYISSGGHNGRTPAEIVSDLKPDMSPKEATLYGLDVARIKLDILLDQIGKPLPDGEIWPRLSPDFDKMWLLRGSRLPAGAGFDTAVLSAGITRFIKNSFEQHDLSPPEILITDDVLGELGLHAIPPEKRAKPETLLLDLAEFIWRQRNNIADEQIIDRKKQIKHVGDDEIKDRGLAQNAAVGFQQFRARNSKEIWGRILRWTNAGTISVRSAVENVAK